MRSISLLLALASLVFVSAFNSSAQDKKKDEKKKVEPKVVVALPLGVAAGKAQKVVLRGMNLENAETVRVSNAVVKIVSKGKAGVPDKNPERVGDTQVEVDITVAKDVKGPSIDVVVVTKEGESNAHPLLVETNLPVQPGKEPNEGFKTAMEIKLPGIVEGTIERPKDVEVFRFEAKKGQKVHVEVVASRHGSPLDSMVTIYNEQIQQLAFNDDFDSNHRDSKISFTAPTDGAYFISLIDAHDSGSPIHVYRLIVR